MPELIRQPELSDFSRHWMPDQVRHDEIQYGVVFIYKSSKKFYVKTMLLQTMNRPMGQDAAIQPIFARHETFILTPMPRRRMRVKRNKN